jgi:dCMP deaminase
MLSHILHYKDAHPSERLDWDNYFMSIAVLASCRSTCERLHVGSVLVKHNRLIAMGYNGFIAGAPHVSHVEDGHEQSTIHSEVNAITDCARRGVSLDGATIYVTHYPCINCFKAIVASGIKQILYLEDYNNHPFVAQLAAECGSEIKKI